jgi:hypothetical protein
MAGAWTTLTVKDGGGVSRTMRAWDESGTGSGPYSFGQVLADGSGAAPLAKAEDAAAASGDLGLLMLGVRRDSAASSSGTDGDYSTFNFDASGKLWVNAAASLTGGVAGDVAHDAVDSGNPVKMGFKATTSLSGLTLVSDADRTDGRAGVDGVQITRPHCNLGRHRDGQRHQHRWHLDAVHRRAVGRDQDLFDVGRSLQHVGHRHHRRHQGRSDRQGLACRCRPGVAAFSIRPVPIPGTAATAWNFDGSAAATTVTCSMVGFKSKV